MLAPDDSLLYREGANVIFQSMLFYGGLARRSALFECAFLAGLLSWLTFLDVMHAVICLLPCLRRENKLATGGGGAH